MQSKSREAVDKLWKVEWIQNCCPASCPLLGSHPSYDGGPCRWEAGEWPNGAVDFEEFLLEGSSEVPFPSLPLLLPPPPSFSLLLPPPSLTSGILLPLLTLSVVPAEIIKRNQEGDEKVQARGQGKADSYWELPRGQVLFSVLTKPPEGDGVLHRVLHMRS